MIEDTFYLQSLMDEDAYTLVRVEPRSVDEYSEAERFALVVAMAYDYSNDTPPAVVLNGYDRIRDCPGFGPMLGLTLKQPFVRHTDWEMVYEYESPKLPWKEGIAVLLDVDAAVRIQDPIEKVVVGLKKLLNYFEDAEQAEHKLQTFIESQLPGATILSM